MRKKTTTAFAVLLLFLLPSCSKTDKTGRNILYITDNIKLDKASAARTEEFAASIPGDLIFSPLLYIDEQGAVHNVLAEEINILPGGKDIEIKLKDGIKFHDGKALTAEDFIHEIDRLKKTKQYRTLFKNLKIQIIDKSRFRLINNFQIPDVYEFLSRISVSPPSFTGSLAGTGPFRFGRWLDNGVEFVSNKEYFEGSPGVDKVIYIYEEDEKKRLNKLLKGEADLMVLLSSEVAKFIEKDSRFCVNNIPGGLYTAIFFNNQSPLLRDKAIRRAISMAVDRGGLIEKGLGGAEIKAYSPFQQEMLPRNHKASSFDYRPKDAARLLMNAGWMGGDGVLKKDGKRLRLRFYYEEGADGLKRLVDIMSQQLFEVGIEMEWVPIGYYEFRDKYLKSGDYDAFLCALSTSNSVNYITWHSAMIKDPEGRNYSRYGNKEVDTLLEQLKDAQGMEAKKKIYARMQEIFDEDVPAAFLYNNVVYTAVNRRFNGAEDFVGDVYSIYKIKDWSLNEDYR